MLEYLPTSLSEQAVAPIEGFENPRKHRVQLLAAAVLLYAPAGQAVQAVLPVLDA